MSSAGLAAVIALGAAHIVARYAGARVVAGVLKPLPILLLASMVSRAIPAEPRYGAALLAGLLCSMVGDVCLVFPARFVAGLACFLVGHLFYIGAFAGAGEWDLGAALLILPFVVSGGAMLAFLWPYLARLRPAVVLYVLVIAVMAWTAAVRAAAPGTAAPSGALALGGALLFMVSDGVLATDRFVRPLPGGDGAVMVTYYAAQTLIAASATA
jgi:uncharacterized membrane protein YhhN